MIWCENEMRMFGFFMQQHAIKQLSLAEFILSVIQGTDEDTFETK